MTDRGGGEAQIARAMAIMVLAMLIAPSMDAIAKGLATRFDVSPATVTFGRFVIQTVFLLGFVGLAWRAGSLKVGFSAINVLRGMIMGLAAMLFFTAIKYMPRANVTPGTTLPPTVTKPASKSDANTLNRTGPATMSRPVSA